MNNDWAHLIIEIDGKFYNDEDLYKCAECSEPFAEKASINDDCHCQLCADDLAAENKHQQQERPW
jgi:formylmethanofuran dehydrogenase subunit E